MPGKASQEGKNYLENNESVISQVTIAFNNIVDVLLRYMNFQPVDPMSHTGPN
jgi:hypothetical protein